MGLFDEPFREVEDFLREKQGLKQIRELLLKPGLNWLEEASLILEEESALELGHPSQGSLSFLVWSQAIKKNQDRILILGPDLSELKEKKVLFGQIIRVYGSFPDEYQCYCQLRDALYQTRLKGLMVRLIPSQQVIWCRVNQTALAQGFSLSHLGWALIKKIKALSFVASVEVIFITSGKKDLNRLKPAGEKVARISGALVKMVEEKNFECESCEYWEVCEKVLELKQIRNRLNQPARR